MPYRVFRLNAYEPENEMSTLNEFLRQHRIRSVDRQLVNDGDRSFWSFCVEFEGASSKKSSGSRSDRVDYRALLGDREFALFDRLREVRRKLASEEQVPVYQVCNNDQLIEIVRGEMTDLKSLETIVGMGKARLEKFGEALVSEVSLFLKENNETSRAAD